MVWNITGVGDWEEYIARRRGKAWHVDKERESYMSETFGLYAYQEQFMMDCRTYASWSIAFADKYVRKGKNIAENEELKTKFISDGMSNQFPQELLKQVWDEIVACVGEYSFCKAHAASYARTAFKTAYLKTHYPTHFYAALMTSKGDDQDAISSLIAECKRREIKINPPNINTSTGDFVVNGDGINYRITTIRNVGASAINHIEYLRPITSFDDFMQRREKSGAGKGVVVSLIKAGCFDFDEPNREELLWRFDMHERKKTQVKQEFICKRYEYNDKVKAEWEQQVLGMYISLHPMEKYGFYPLESYAEGTIALVGGEVKKVDVKKDKNGNEMAFVTLDTLFGAVRVLIFSSTWKTVKQDMFNMGTLLMVKGKKSGDAVLLNKVEVLE